jgi:hypothetical protein
MEPLALILIFQLSHLLAAGMGQEPLQEVMVGLAAVAVQVVAVAQAILPLQAHHKEIMAAVPRPALIIMALVVEGQGGLVEMLVPKQAAPEALD